MSRFYFFSELYISSRCGARRSVAPATVLVALSLWAGLAASQPQGVSPRTAAAAPSTSSAMPSDYIIAVVNQEAVSASEVQQRIERLNEAARRSVSSQLPSVPKLREDVINSLIDERIQLTHARTSGLKVEDPELQRAIQSVAAQNQLSPEQLKSRLQSEGIDFQWFRNNLKEQILMERVREREVQARISISESNIDDFLNEQRADRPTSFQYNIAQVLIPIPEGANAAEIEQRRVLADRAWRRVRGGEPFEAVAREMSADGNREQGGVIGMRSVERLPGVFVQHVKELKSGEIASSLLRTNAGFHVLKLIEKRDTSGFMVQQTRTRHILLKSSAQLSQQAAIRRLNELKRQVEQGKQSFEVLASRNSEDASAARGGDLGWTTAGAFVPEFEAAMNTLSINGVSDPVVSRFGVHLIQVLERREVELTLRQLREQARAVLREKKYEEAYLEWMRELRARAYIERRDQAVL
jgi:peptidyl-prolyl cis-trans isomerase SurA